MSRAARRQAPPCSWCGKPAPYRLRVHEPDGATHDLCAPHWYALHWLAWLARVKTQRQARWVGLDVARAGVAPPDDVRAKLEEWRVPYTRHDLDNEHRREAA